MKKTKLSKFSLKKQYKESWNFIKQSSSFIYTIVGLFILFILIGAFLPTPKSLEAFILQTIKDIVGSLEGLNTFGLVIHIFINNMKASLLALLLGILFGIFPVFSAISNGYLIGYVSKITIKEEGILILWRLLPHGIFELPAIMISLGIGLKLGIGLFKSNNFKLLKQNIKKALWVFALIVFPLLLIAGIIEGLLVAFLG